MTHDPTDGTAAEFSHAANNGSYRDDPAFKKLPKTEQWRLMAERGDVRSLLAEASQTRGANILMGALCGCVQYAIEHLARTDPAAFVTFLQTDMLACVGKMVIRAQRLLDKELRNQSCDQHLWSEQPAFDKLAETVLTLQVEVAKLLYTNAGTQLILERARKLKLANDKAEAKKNRPRRARCQRISRPQPMTANARIGGDLP